MKRLVWLASVMFSLCLYIQRSADCESESKEKMVFCSQSSFEIWDEGTDVSAELPVNVLSLSSCAKWQNHRHFSFSKLTGSKKVRLISLSTYPVFREVKSQNILRWSLRRSKGLYVYDIRKIVV